MGVFRRVEASLVPYGHVNYTHLQTGLLFGLKTPPVTKSMLQDVLWHASAASEGTGIYDIFVHGPSQVMAKTACILELELELELDFTVKTARLLAQVVAPVRHSPLLPSWTR